MRLIYTIIFYIGLPFTIARLFRKAKQNPEYKKRIGERLGIYRHYNPQPADIWLHAVSLGEAIAATPLIAELIKSHKVVITTTTPTGSNYIKTTFGLKVQHVYLPYDIGLAINSFLNKFQPKKLIIMETEIWPNVLHFCHKRDVATSIVNARISDDSVQKYVKAKFFFQPFIANINWVGAQTEEDRERFILMGADPTKANVIPNIKLAAKTSKEIKPEIVAKTKDGIKSRPAWVAGSTHADEDIAVINAQIEILKDNPDALLIIVPRHLKCAENIIKYATENNLKILSSSKDILTRDTNIWLVDQMGVLQDYYKLAPIAFVGGSLVPIGGHNLLEPVRTGAIVLSGNELHNFKLIRDDLLQHQALQIIHDANSLAEKVTYYFNNVTERQEIKERGLHLIESQSEEVLKPILAWVNS